MVWVADHFVHSVRTYSLIAAGGIAGSTLRWSVGDVLDTDAFPWATLLVNVVGCGLLAAVLNTGMERTIRAALATGFCGGLTTFSTLTVDVVRLTDSGDPILAIVYLVTSVTVGLAVFIFVRETIRRQPIDATERSI